MLPPLRTTFGQSAQAKPQRFGEGWIDLLPGYKFEHVVGPDFGVDYIIPSDAHLDNATIMLGLYAGNAPSFHPPTNGVTTRAGHLGARKIKWYIWNSVADNQTIYHYQALIKIKGGVWHLFMAAPDMKSIQQLMSILESYRSE